MVINEWLTTEVFLMVRYEKEGVSLNSRKGFTPQIVKAGKDKTIFSMISLWPMIRIELHTGSDESNYE
jgi:hypothetical protein